MPDIPDTVLENSKCLDPSLRIKKQLRVPPSLWVSLTYLINLFACRNLTSWVLIRVVHFTKYQLILSPPERVSE